MSTVSLLEIEPDLGAWLGSEEQERARRLRVPTARLGASSPELDRVLEETDAFAALVIDGMVMHRMTIAGRAVLRLLGPGDIIVHTWAPRSEILGRSSKHAIDDTRIALLGRQLVSAAREFPGLIVGLHMRLGDQHQRLAVQLGICQLPRVQERVLALLWLLAESWGRVTPSGTLLPVKLTHSMLGALVGARRPTVTLALGDLVDRGALLVQDDGWLLLSEPMTTTDAPPDGIDPSIIAARQPAAVSTAADDAGTTNGTSAKGDAEITSGTPGTQGTPDKITIDREQIAATVRDLHAGHATRCERTRAIAAKSRDIQERSRLLKELIADEQTHLPEQTDPELIEYDEDVAAPDHADA